MIAASTLATSVFETEAHLSRDSPGSVFTPREGEKNRPRKPQ
jgi:hypothetical protein